MTDNTLWSWFCVPSNRSRLLSRFMTANNVLKLRPWQSKFLDQDLEEQSNCILQLPPGSGKTFLAQWIVLESLLQHPRHRVIFAVPLRALAVQLTKDLEVALGILNDELDGSGKVFTVQLAEGPGARINLLTNHVVVATYEHAAGELRKDPAAAKHTGTYRWIGSVILDEIHNIAKADRGLVIDDILYFSKLRKLTNPHKNLRVVGLSGTLEDWVASRLLNSYSCLFKQVYNAVNLQIPETPTRASRILLDSTKFNTGVLLTLVRDIVKYLALQRLNQPPDTWKRLVVFMSSVAEAELAYVFMSTDQELQGILAVLRRRGAYKAPKIRLVNSIDKLTARFNRYKVGTLGASRGSSTSEIATKLESAGIYLHHAQLGGQRPTETQQGWSDSIQDQLATKDFLAVFSTSTLSVGINLNSTQIGVLGPNTMWSIDQAEQMIGRVGRSSKDAEHSVVLVVDSPLYEAPGVSSVLVPTTWFVPRLAAAIEFAVNSEKRGNHRVLKPQNKVENLDIRGFFRPYSSAAPGLPDQPGNSVVQIAEDWGVVAEGCVSKAAKAALGLCKQDLKSLPATIQLVNTAASGHLPWTLLLLWSLLVTRLPTCWTKLESEGSSHKLTEVTFNKQVFNQQEADQAAKLIKLYGEAHSPFKGDPQTPGASTVSLVLEFFEYFVYSVGMYTDRWLTGDPADLLEVACNLIGFLQSLTEDINQLFEASTEFGFDAKVVKASIEDAKAYLEGLLLYDTYKCLPIELIGEFQSCASFCEVPEVPEDRRLAVESALAEAYSSLGLDPLS